MFSDDLKSVWLFSMEFRLAVSSPFSSPYTFSKSSFQPKINHNFSSIGSCWFCPISENP